jgi:hypothetical protein
MELSLSPKGDHKWKIPVPNGLIYGKQVNRFRHGWAHAEGVMRPDVVVLFEPLIDDGLCLSCCCEPFGVENFTTQCSVEAFIVSILPR